MLSARLVAGFRSQEHTTEPFSLCTSVADTRKNNRSAFKPECSHPGCRLLKIYFTVWEHPRWPACPSGTRQISHTCQTSSGNHWQPVFVFLVMYTTNAVVFAGCLLVGTEMKLDIYKGRQFHLSAMSDCNGKGGSRCNSVGLSYRVQVFWYWFKASTLGPPDRASVHLFVCLLMTNVVIAVVFHSCIPTIFPKVI